MNPGYMVEVANVNKVFHTHHFLQRHEESGKRAWYRKKTVRAARNISFGIRKGEIFGLLGPNGAGKTTTVKMISGLVRPTAGAVYVDGMNVDTKRLATLRRIGVVLEGTRTSIWPLTPLENLAYFGNLRDVKGPVLRKRGMELLDLIGLKDKMNVQVRHLSRGQKQKLAICIALISDPPVLLLDEPTTGLDVQSSRSIKDKILEITRELGKCVLVTTHDMNVAQELCDNIGIIADGRLVACKPTHALIDYFSDVICAFYLDRAADPTPFLGIPGVLSAECNSEDGEYALVLRLIRQEDQRSAALYAIVELLKNSGRLLHGVERRKQTLENVFIQLTSGLPPATGD